MLGSTFMSETTFMEQRAQKRYEFPEAYVVNPDSIGRLLNISKDGLSFQSLDAVVSVPEKWVLDIIIPAEKFHLEQVSVELVWKKLDDHSSFYSIPTETVGVRLGDLDDYQVKMLHNLFL